MTTVEGRQNGEELDAVADRAIFDEYRRRCERLGGELVDDMKAAGAYAGSGPFNGYRWARERDVPIDVFPHVIDARYDVIDCGSNSYFVWLIPEEYRNE